MSRLSQAARNGALAAIGLYLISTSTVLASFHDPNESYTDPSRLAPLV